MYNNNYIISQNYMDEVDKINIMSMTPFGMGFKKVKVVFQSPGPSQLKSVHFEVHVLQGETIIILL